MIDLQAQIQFGNRLHSLIAMLATYKITKFAKDSDGQEIWEPDDRHEASIIDGANAVSSKRAAYVGGPKYHAVLLDIDVPSWHVPSSTPGHAHLYVDVHVKEADYFELLDQLAKCGVIQKNYAEASKAKGGTFLRLPWVKKPGMEVSPAVPVDFL